MKHTRDDSTVFLVRAVTRAMRRRFDRNLAAAGFKFTHDQWAVLITLWNRDGQTQKDLGYITMMGKVNITRLIDGMEKEGWIIRRTDDEDRRQRRILITAGGKALYRDLLPTIKNTLREAEKNVDNAALKTFKNVLRQMMRNLTD
jgi:DNA-binding MarR family transcriptional regulator